jgi:GT2 family glycosyltransferase
MKTSLILCVKDGGEQLETCLTHLGQMNTPPQRLEIFLVDNGSTHARSSELMAAFVANSSVSCRVLRTFVPGNGAGRNCALKEASGELLLFTDADCYVEPEFVNDWLAVFAAHDVGFGSGRIMRISHQASMLGCKENRAEQILAAESFVPRGFINGSNMAFRRACFDRVGLFDERFGAGATFAGEDWDIALRSSFAGFSGGYFPTPGVTHDHRREGKIANERQLFYDYGAGAVYAKHILSSKGLRVIRKFLGDIRYSRDRRRRERLLKGFIDYNFKPSLGKK